MKGKFLPSQNSKDSCIAHTGRTPGTKTWKTMRYLMLLIAVIMLMPFSGISQTITIDGNPSDWPAVLTNQPIATFVKDKPQNNDNQFTSGTKDYDLASGMSWSYSPVGDKVNLVNGGAAIIDGWLYFFGDRTSSLGSAQIGFWVFQNGTSPDETNFGFSPEKTPGDLLILSEFTNGGGVATIKAYRWLGSGSGVNRLQEIPLTQAQALAMVSANSSGFPVPSYPDWEYCNKEKKDCGFYYPGTFFEGKVDLTGLLTPEQLCNATFLLETRQSFSLNSMLGDFIAGSFNISPDPPALQAAHSCEPGALVTLSVLNPKQSETYKWYADAALTNLVHTGTSYSFNITQNTTFWVTGSEGSCEGKPSQVTATVTQLSCNIINYTPPIFGQSAGSAEVQVLVNGQASNLPYTIHWSHDGSSSTSVSNLTNAGTTVTVTLGNCTTTCGVPAAQGCPDLSYNLGCNPTLPNEAMVKADLEAHYGQGSVITITSFSAGSVVSDGCSRSQVVTVSYQDQLGNVESGCTVTYTWKEDTTAPEITTTGQGGELGCNPSADDINAALGSATADDGCDGNVNVVASTAPVVENGCSRSQTRTFTATDACGNSASKSVTVTWKVDVTAPEITTTGQGGELGCNPSADDINAALGSATANDGCDGNVNVVTSTAPVVENGCYRSQTRTFTATDACGNSASKSVTVTWKVDVTAPEITTTGQGGELGCNPSADAINAALGSATANDGCDGSVNVVTSTAPVVENGCSRSQTRTFTATDACGNSASKSVTVTWKVDVTAPEITTTGQGGELGCNPSADDINAALGSATANDGCDGNVNVVTSTAPVVENGCYRSQTRTFTATDACGNSASKSVTVAWKVDVTAPEITTTGQGGDLGCNPSADDINAALGSATASDGCDGSVNVVTTTAPVVENGCSRSQTRTFTATDACGNSASKSVTVTWKVDVTAPEITTTGQGGDLGCNPSADDINAALGSATADDGCDGSVNVVTTTAPVVENGCSRSQTRTFTAIDACGNSASKSVTVTWKEDTTGPELQGELTNLQFVCDQDVVLPNPQFTDNCGGAITVTYAINGSAVTAQQLAAYVFPQGNTQVCYKAVDECGNPTEFCIIITVAPCEETCETAFGKGATASCFIPDFSRWGWTNVITPGSYSFELWAAAGQCDTNKGTLVGSVDVVYANGHVTVTYNVIPPYRLDATHTYVGTTKYPQVKKGRTTTSTVAPGSYYYAGPFNGGPVYVIAHAVVCGQFGTPVVEESVVEKSAVIERLDNASELRVYPNPFNSRVAFEFVSDKNANARLEIYNNVGQRITTLFDKPVERGVLNRVEYTPVNVTHGVLFYRLQLDDEVQNGKLLYTK